MVRTGIIFFAVTIAFIGPVRGEAKISSAGPPTFSVPHGFYTSSFDLTITIPTPNAVVRLTVDGSDPRYSATAVQQISPAVIRIDPESTYSSVRGKTPGVVIRACGTAPGMTTSDAVTNTYLFTKKLAALSPEGVTPGPGWPKATASASPQAFDYGMAPVIVNDPRYKNLIDSALLSIPSVCIATDLKYLFSSDSGIYVNAMMDGKDWERPASIELLRADKIDGFQINAGLRLRGGYSRHGEDPKHAFRFFFRSEYGKGKLDYPLFDNEGTTKFDKVDLRTGQNYAWSYPGHLGRYNTMISDVFCRDLQGAMGQPYTRSRFYHLYLNGVYWGLYQTQERAEANFAASYFGGSSDDYDVVKINDDSSIEATDGTLDSYRNVWNACTAGFKPDSNYFGLQGMEKTGIRNTNRKILVNIDNLIDFMLVIFYSGNFDSPVSAFGQNQMPNNFYCIYNHKLNDGFRFFIHDAEHTLRTTAGEGPGIGLTENRVNIGTLATSNKMTVTDFSKFHPQWIHFRLSDNAEYRLRFADHAYKYFFNQGCMTPDKSIAMFRSRAKEIDMAIIAESARWGNTYLSPAATKDDDWQPAIDDIVNHYFPSRFAIVVNQLRQVGLYPAIDPPIFQLNGETIAATTAELGMGTSVVLQRPLYEDGIIIYTCNGDDPRTIGGAVSGTAFSGNAETTITPDTTMTVKARVLNGSTWSALHEINLKVTSGVTAVRGRDEQVPAAIGLLQNFPNPFNPATTIRYSIAHASHVTLTIYNMLGAAVDVLVNEFVQPGTHGVSWNAGSHSSGIYFCKMIVAGPENFSSVKKLLLMK
jgi:hypothetical protein